jgi:hypothetical protein
MSSLSSLRLAKAAVVAGLAGVSLLVAAASPDAKKPERRVPPTGAQMSEIPAGVDSGTPSTSNSMQLGMPVPPSQQSADQAEQNRRSSAAARAAARPASSSASNAYAKPIGPVITTVEKKPPAKASTTTSAAAKPASAPPR